MSYFDGAFTVSDVYQYRLSDAWPVNGYRDVFSQFDPLFNLTKFATTGSFSTQLDEYGIGLTVLYPFNADTSTNKFEVTVFGDTKAANFNPYTPGYYSAYFDGTGDYLTTPTSSTLGMGSGDFTIECWVYATSPTYAQGFFHVNATSIGGTVAGYAIGVTAAGAVEYYSGATYTTTSSTITANRWTHLALVRSSGTVKVYVNGILPTSGGSIADSQNVTSALAHLGVFYATNYPMVGYISNFRVVKGSALYISNFTPPTAPLTAVSGTSLLACQSNRFIDNSPNNFAITVNGNTAINPTNPFTVPSSVAVNNFYSAYFDGTGDYLTVPANAAFAPGTGDFTVEGWFNATDLMNPTGGIIYGQAVSGTNYFVVYATNGLVAFIGTLSGGGSPITSGANNWTLGTWNHFAVVRNSGSVTVYLNGIAGTAIADTNNYTDTSMIPTIGRYTHADSNLFFGSISNLRYVKGTAVYTSAFTPSTTPLTAIAGTSLLTCQSPTLVDNSTNNFPITSFGQAQPIPQSPFTQTTTSVSTTYLGSAYFDGTGDYLSIPDNAALNIGISDFQFSCWVYPTVFNSSNTLIGKGTNNLIVAFNSSGTLEIAQYGVAQRVLASTNLVLNRWSYVVATRFSATSKIFINGVEVGSGSDSSNYTSSTVLQIGQDPLNSDQKITGYISDLQLINGTALYRTNFAVPQSPLTAVTNTSLLTLQTNQPHNNTTFLDKSNNKFLITRVGNTTQGTFSPYNGSWSNYFDGATGTRLSLTSNLAFAFGTLAYTMEGWVYITTAPTYTSTLFDAGGTTNAISLGVTSAGAVAIGKYGIGNVLASSSGDVPLNQWVHIAAVRTSTSSNDTRLYVNGVLRATGTDNNNWTVTNTPTVGGINLSGYTTFGYISNLRIVKGTAVYTSAFTPPTAPLLITSGTGILASTPTGAQDPPVNNATSLLTCQSNRFIDNGQFGFVITKNGGVSVSSESPFPRSLPPLETGEPSNYGYYFDGSASYLIFDPAASPQSGTYTIEFWYYPMAKVSTDGTIFTNQDTYNSPGHITIYDRPDSYPNSISISMAGIYNYPVTENAWYHIAITQNNATGDRIAHFNGYTTSIGGGGNQSPSSTRCYIGRGYASDFNNGYTNINGIISNFRITQSALYSYSPYPQNFIPTAPLSALPTTTLLTAQSSTFVDNGIYNLTPNVIGNVRIVSSVVNNINGGNVNPFRRVTIPSLTDYTPTIYGGSGYFDGTDYLTAPSSAAFTVGTSDFTIEGWFYVNSLGANGFIAFDNRASASAIPFTIGVNSSGNPYLYDGTVVPTGSSGITVSTWAHIAWVRTSGVLKMFVNGISVYSAAYTTNLNGSTATIGSGIGGLAGYFLNGYMSDFRFVNGTALYTRNFDPPIAPPTPSGNTSLLLNFTDAAIKDYTMRSNMETMADLKVSSANSKFGGTSLYFDGTGDYGNISPVSNTLILGTGDFTAEMWINPYSNITTTYPMTIGSEAAGGYSIILINGTLNVNLFGGATANLTLNGPRIPANAWSHIAVVRAAGNVRGYYNGNVLPNTQVNSSIIGNGPLRLGSNGLGTSNFFGYMDDVRITANARYTANFIPAITYLPTR